jgi:predicted transcriptional regulator
MDITESSLAVVARYQHRAPVDLERIARDLGIRVYREPLGPQISGQIVRNAGYGGSTGFAISINSTDPPNRQRFTFAHELAHFILHRDLIETGVVDNAMYRSNLSDYYEVQANRLAADILMPVPLVRHFLAREGGNVQKLASLFGVSPQAMQIRLNGIDAGQTH